MKHCVTNMLRSGLELYPYTSVQDDEVLVLIRCPLDILKAFTDKVDFKLLADPLVLEDTLTTGVSCLDLSLFSHLTLHSLLESILEFS